MIETLIIFGESEKSVKSLRPIHGHSTEGLSYKCFLLDDLNKHQGMFWYLSLKKKKKMVGHKN